MRKVKLTPILLLVILALSFFFRFYKLEEIPWGIHQDAVSQAYNAFSILQTGKDRYGEFFPILFRSFGSYQPPLYTYLTIIPIMLFGNTIYSSRVISALSGVLAVVLTYLIISHLFRRDKNDRTGILASLLLAISPWAIFFSRMTVEANLGLTVFLLGYYLLLKSLDKIALFPLAAVVMGFSTHAYYCERIIGPLFFLFFIFWYRKIYWKSKGSTILGIFLFFALQIPHLIIFSSGAFSRRFAQAGYIAGSGSVFKTLINQVLLYISPKYLFSDAGRSLGRLLPEMGPFFSWLFIPFLLGLKALSAMKDKNVVFQFVFLTAISLVPASLTGDIFYPLRVLEFLWMMTIVISLGINYLVDRTKFPVRLMLIPLMLYSLLSLFVSYFIFFKYEKAKDFSYPYVKLIDSLGKYSDRQIVIDTGRDLAEGLRIAYFWKTDPRLIQDQLQSQLLTPYYSGDVNASETYSVENIEVRPISWGEDSCRPNSIIIGDSLAISPEQTKRHNLSLEFEVQDENYEPFLFGYSTNPPASCDKP
jgi:4-amino-4-deoxy-L-arabinose transferase-like glycosyltransferase